jgi:hypothetical protein
MQNQASNKKYNLGFACSFHNNTNSNSSSCQNASSGTGALSPVTPIPQLNSLTSTLSGSTNFLNPTSNNSYNKSQKHSIGQNQLIFSNLQKSLANGPMSAHGYQKLLNSQLKNQNNPSGITIKFIFVNLVNQKFTIN